VTSSNSFQNPYNPFPPNSKEVTVTFAWNIAGPYMGVFFMNGRRTGVKRHLAQAYACGIEDRIRDGGHEGMPQVMRG
jgi:hypothetical protein